MSNIIFLKLTWGADSCSDTKPDSDVGKPFIVNMSVFDMIYPDQHTGGAILRYRADYDRAMDPVPPSPNGRSTYHLHVQETVEEIWGQMDVRFLASLPR